MNQDRLIHILIADDDSDDRLLLQEAWAEVPIAKQLHFVENGEELMDYLYHRNAYSDSDKFPRPDLILLDLNMPKKDGRQALKEIKVDSHLRQIPVVVLTTSRTENDIKSTYDLGGNSFITKPITFHGLVDAMKVLGKYWFEIMQLPPQPDIYST